MSTGAVVFMAVVFGLCVGFGCLLWGRSNDLSDLDASIRRADLAGENLRGLVDCQLEHSVVWCNEHRSTWEVDTDVPTDQPDSWPADNPALSGLIAGIATLVVGRLYLFMRRLETVAAS